MKVGVIGTGNMGTILSEALIDSRAITPSEVIVVNRTKAKAEMLKHKYSEIIVANHAREVIQNSNLIFLCVKPNEYFSLIKENEQYFRKDQCLVTITSPIQTSWLEKLLPCSCVRIIPSITNRALAGVTLFTFGELSDQKWQKQLIDLFTHISVPIQIKEEITRISSDIVSCGPAFFSYITRRFIEAAVSETLIDRDTATKLAEEMLIGLGELLNKGYYSLPTLEEKVCVKGGITGEGIKVLEKELDGVFEEVLRATHAKFNEEVEILKKDFPL
ncbi:late competence protein ComER [Bacillus sp. FJAT-49732]|uniref:Late competence protein ComER n=1 Tax=Lederbergia citrisecunda TaxID=2833583 RepID=A0A942TM11_9BACI|nr:late competence protein ComER [Lederbergia citrisecunda]MBS4199738.1 late competence protein ComER [Lederbergia citrisecunda]